jgi:hypothetical protein
MAEERAMLYLLLEQACGWDGWTRHAAVRALQGTLSSPDQFVSWIDWLRQQLGSGIDERIRADFIRLADAGGVLDRLDDLLSRIGRSWRLPSALRSECYDLVGKLRTVLAQAGVGALEPDLVILDEFQRFRHLLDLTEGGEAAELAHHLFDHGDARVCCYRPRRTSRLRWLRRRRRGRTTIATSCARSTS